MQIYKVVNMLAALNDTNRLASDMYELGKIIILLRNKTRVYTYISNGFSTYG